MATTSLPDMGAVGRGINSRLTILENGKAGLESPNFTGSPMAPTAPEGTKNTHLATTAFVHQEFDETKNLAEGVYGAFTSFNTDNGIV